MRWIFTLIAVFCFTSIWFVSSALWFGLGLVIAIVSSVFAALFFAQHRIDSDIDSRGMPDIHLQAMQEAARRKRDSSDHAARTPDS